MLYPHHILTFLFVWFVLGVIRSFLDRGWTDKLLNGVLWGLVFAIPGTYLLTYLP